VLKIIIPNKALELQADFTRAAMNAKINFKELN